MQQRVARKSDTVTKHVTAVEIPTVRLYIKDRDKARKSAFHTVYAGSKPLEPGSTTPQTLTKLEFWFGVARSVPTQDAQRFIDLGHATTERPKSAWEEAEERETREGR